MTPIIRSVNIMNARQCGWIVSENGEQIAAFSNQQELCHWLLIHLSPVYDNAEDFTRNAQDVDPLPPMFNDKTDKTNVKFFQRFSNGKK